MKINSLEDLKAEIMNAIYPIGSIYMSTSNTNPSGLFGGEWNAWGSGKVPVGVDSNNTNFDIVEKTGGNETQKLRAAIGATHATTTRIGYMAAEKIPNVSYKYSTNGYDGIGDVPYEDINHSTMVYQQDGSDPSTLQPYITCYMWKRVS